MADIFLSYARENHGEAQKLADILAGYGWTVFWDREILAGSVFDDVIQEQLDHAKCVVCLWSVHSVDSQWVRAEAEEGANRNMLVSVLVDDVRLPIAFRRIQAAKLLNWTGSKDDEQLRDVLKAVKFVVEKPPQVNNTTSGVQVASQTTTSDRSSSTLEESSRTKATALELAPLQRPWWKQTRNIGLIFSILILGAAAAYYWWVRSGSAGPIDKKYSELGASRGLLGAPVGKEQTTADGIGRARHYEKGVISWSPTTGAHEVHGDILKRWQDHQLEQGLGYPTTDETVTPDGVGRFNHFRKDHDEGSIYWTPATGAHAVHGEIRKKWAELGWELRVGYPTTDETVTPDGVGRFNHFRKDQNENSIYWTPTTGAHAVYGEIRKKWAELGWEQGLGYPTTDETVTPDGVGRFNHFRKDQNEGSIYWTPATGAHAVYGEIRKKWAALGWERSFLGYPVTDEGEDQSGGRQSSFQHGVLRWRLEGGLEVMPERNQ
jgi:uncharacterized protein with LGFP repeats